MAHPTTTEYFATAIRDVAQTINEKCQLLGDVLSKSQAKFHAVERDARARVFHHMPLIQEMDRVFQQLQGILVGRQSASASDASGNKTLFDYVDAETVQSLQQDAAEQAKEVEEMLIMHRDALDRVGVMYQYFCSFKNKYAQQIQAATVNQTRQQDVKVLEQFYDVAVRFFVDMEQCDRYLLRYFSTINDVYPHYESAFAEAETLFDELRSLQEFYRHFLDSYQQLDHEFERRSRYVDRVNKLLNDTMAKLQVYEQEEQQARAAFIHEHARYLPASLCPELKDPPEQYDIVRVDSDKHHGHA